MTTGGVLTPARDGVRLAVRVTPRARNKIIRIAGGAGEITEQILEYLENISG